MKILKQLRPYILEGFMFCLVWCVIELLLGNNIDFTELIIRGVFFELGVCGLRKLEKYVLKR